MIETCLIAKNNKELLAHLLQREGISLDMPCAGNHTCGKCKVKVSGAMDEMSEAEAALLSGQDRAAGMRLACFAYALGEINVYLPQKRRAKILTESIGDLRVNEPLMASDRLGIAIDIGTTTVVCKLFDAAGCELAVVNAMNKQSSFGADVISRINSGIRFGNEPITDAIVNQIEEMVAQLAAKADVAKSRITHAVAVGNTTMLHCFCGLDPEGIGCAPFTPMSLFDSDHDDIIEGISIYIPPCVSAYVGADLVACLIATRLREENNTALLVDIGTNGEMALIHQGELYCCSTAAGPAFEGAGITWGMNASSGAIAHIGYDEDEQKVIYDTIDDAPAIGLCGSGIIDLTALLFAHGAMKSTGSLVKEGHELSACMGEKKEFIFPGGKIAFTQADVRQVQLAKAAILGGMMTLADNCEINIDDLSTLYLCGGFGTYLDPNTAEAIGLIPAGSSKKVVNMGNAALLGAAMLLLDHDARVQIASIAKDCFYIELSGNASFMDNYISAMSF